jgi:hypothetical protein
MLSVSLDCPFLLSVSLDCSFLITPLVFSNLYLYCVLCTRCCQCL